MKRCVLAIALRLVVIHSFSRTARTIAPVQIGDDVWLPWHVFVLPGATIGEGATVGAFSLVAGVIPPNTLAVGVPARVVKDAQQYRRVYDTAEMKALVGKTLRQVLTNTVESWKPRSLFFPAVRSIVEAAPGDWILTGDGQRARVVLLHELRGATTTTFTDLVNTLFVVVDAADAIPQAASWIDPLSLRASLRADIAPLLREVVDGLSVFGIRFRDPEHVTTPSQSEPPNA
jgi:hypothetical protein